MKVRLCFVVGALVLFFAPAAPLPASEVRAQIAIFAKDIARLIKGEATNAVAVGEFTGPPVPTTSAGPSIQVALIEELGKLKVTIDENAFIFVKGEYFVLEEEKEKKDLTIRLLATLRNKKGKKIHELSTDIGYRGNEDMVKLLAMNADLSKHTKADREGQNQKLKRDLEKPPLYVPPAGTQIKVSNVSPYAVEVLTRYPGGQLKVQTPEGKKGQAFVEIKKGEEYVLRLHNTSKYEAAVSVTIDGVDAFQFFEPAKGQTRPSTFLIGPGRTRDVEGWLLDTTKLNYFLVGSFADSAAAKALKGSAKIGTITICFHPCWEGQKAPAEYEGSRSSSPNATGFGAEKKVKTNVVNRTIGPLVAAVSIRYNK